MANNPLAPSLNKLAATIDRLKPQLVHTIAVEAKKFVDDNFVKEGFQGDTFQPWPKRAKETKRTTGKKVLQDTGTLRRSIKSNEAVDTVTISSDIPYARIHNDGGTITLPARTQDLNFNKKGKFTKANTESQQRRVKNSKQANIGQHTTQMPKRQFVGDSPILRKEIKSAIRTKIAQNIKIIH